jgi:hypothetical protein
LLPETSKRAQRAETTMPQQFVPVNPRILLPVTVKSVRGRWSARRRPGTMQMPWPVEDVAVMTFLSMWTSEMPAAGSR